MKRYHNKKVIGSWHRIRSKVNLKSELQSFNGNGRYYIEQLSFNYYIENKDDYVFLLLKYNHFIDNK